jgi:hypothetical protein
VIIKAFRIAHVFPQYIEGLVPRLIGHLVNVGSGARHAFRLSNGGNLKKNVPAESGPPQSDLTIDGSGKNGPLPCA